MDKYQKREIEKQAEQKGYSWNSDGSAMTNGSKKLSWSDTGNSVKLNGTTYNTPSGTKNSTKW